MGWQMVNLSQVKTLLEGDESLLLRAGADDYKECFDSILRKDPQEEVKFIDFIKNKQFFKGIVEAPSNIASSSSNASSSSSSSLAPPQQEPKISDIRQLIAEKRVLLALRDASDTLLNSIIMPKKDTDLRELLVSTEGKRIFGDFTTITGWDTKNERLITGDALRRIVNKAQQYYLSKWVSKQTDMVKLKALSDANTDEQLVLAARAMGYPKPAVDDLKVDDLNLIRADLAKKLFIDAIQKADDNQIRIWAPFLNDAINKFKAEVGQLNLKNEDIDSIKGLIGERNLKRIFSEEQDLTVLISLAGNTKVEDLRFNLNKNGSYVNLAVTEATLPSLRLAAASQVLRMKIEQSNDQTLLKKISQAKNYGEILQLVEKEHSLGLVGNIAFHSALSPELNVGQLVAASKERVESHNETIKQGVIEKIKTNIDAHSPHKSNAHKVLVALLEQLPVNKLQQLLNDLKKVGRLLIEKDAEVLNRILSEPDLDTVSLARENERLQLFSQIHNAEIARILAKVIPPIPINLKMIKEINEAIFTNIDEPARYIQTVERIVLAIYLNTDYSGDNNKNLYKSFDITLDNAGQTQSRTLDVPHPIEELVTSQYRKNIALLEKIANSQDPVIKEILGFVLTLDKSRAFTESEVTELIQDFRSAENRSNLIEIIRRAPYAHKLHTSWQLLLTPDAYQKINHLIKKEALSNEGNYEEILKKFEADLADDRKKSMSLAKTDKQIQSALNTIARLNTLNWINPAFKDEAKVRASKLENKFFSLAEHSSEVVLLNQGLKKRTEEQLAVLKEAKRSDFVVTEHRTALDQRIQKLKKDLQRINTILIKYQPLQKRLKGDPASSDPLLQKGILQTLKEAKQGNQEIQFTDFYNKNDLANSYEDFPAGERANLLNKTGVKLAPATDPTSGERPGQVVHEGFRAINRLATGYIREHRISSEVISGQGPSIVGRFLEEHEPIATPKETTKIAARAQSAMKLTASEFPDISTLEGCDAAVTLTMAMAAKLTEDLVIPLKNKPAFILRGANKDQVAYLWTALMIIGKNDPKKKFDKDAIKIISNSEFTPSTETGFLFGFSKKSKYETVFKDSPHIQTYLNSIKQVSDVKTGNITQFKALKEAVNSIAFQKAPSQKAKAGAKVNVEDEATATVKPAKIESTEPREREEQVKKAQAHQSVNPVASSSNETAVVTDEDEDEDLDRSPTYP